ncbi:MAG: hypothetical protein KJ749_09515, partial [Planctomycetes bacterium]|nr:hypothetical protein [Planctomycetota bacterium]
MLTILQAGAVVPASGELTREQAETAMARITDVYREAANLTFILEIAQEPTGAYRIHTVHRPDFVWFRVEEDGKPIYEAWATDV